VLFEYNLINLKIIKNTKMINALITKLFGDPSEKKVQFYIKEIENIKISEKKFESFNLTDVKNKTAEFKAKFE